MVETDCIEARPSAHQLAHLNLDDDAHTSTSAGLSLLLHRWQEDLAGIPASSWGDELS